MTRFYSYKRFILILAGAVLALSAMPIASAGERCADGEKKVCNEAKECACAAEHSTRDGELDLRLIQPMTSKPDGERKQRPVLDMTDTDKDGVMVDENPTVPSSGAQSLLSFDEALAVCRRIDNVDLQACIDKKTGQRSGHYMLGLSLKEDESPPKETVTEQVLIRD